MEALGFPGAFDPGRAYQGRSDSKPPSTTMAQGSVALPSAFLNAWTLFWARRMCRAVIRLMVRLLPQPSSEMRTARTTSPRSCSRG